MPQISHDMTIGGGAGYEFTTTSAVGTTTARSIGQLKSAMSSASQEDVIYVPGGAQIDATGERQLEFGADGVTLASNRGIDGAQGGLIYANDYATANVQPLIDTSRSNIRITGLRFRGPESDPMLLL